MFEKYKRNSAAKRLLEERLFEQVVNELANGQRRNGLWGKALANSEGIEEKAKTLYIQYRVQSIKDEFELERAIAEESRKRAIGKKEEIIIKLKESFTSLGCSVKEKNGAWYIVDAFGGKITVDSLEDLKVTEQFMRRVFHAIHHLSRRGYKVRQMSNGWVIKKFPEGSTKVSTVEELEKYAKSK